MNDKLFKYFEQEHGVMLLESDINEIKNMLSDYVLDVSISFADYAMDAVKAGCNDSTPVLFAKFMEMRFKLEQPGTPTCPSCYSNRLLDWPDYYQCRLCGNIIMKKGKSL